MRLDRRAIRYGGAFLATVMAAIYYLIGLGVLNVVAPGSDTEGLLFFGAMAGSGFLLGGLLLVAFDRRVLWVLGVLLQLFVVWGYIAVSPSRDPQFEVWGITLRVIQVPLLAALVYLAVRKPELQADRT